MRVHNFGTVLAFELRRTLLRPVYWLTTLSVPALMIAVMALSFFSNTSAADQSRSASTGVTFTYSDASGIVSPEVAQQLGGTLASDPDAAAQAVRDGTSDAYISVPANPGKEPVGMIARDEGLFKSGHWGRLAETLVADSAAARIGDQRLVTLTRSVPVSVELWKNGHLSPGFAGAILPGFFLVLLYAAILMLSQQMLNITVEEKENRVTEMILTTIKPSVLILAKVSAVIVAGLVQATVFMVPALVWGWVSSGDLKLPASGLSGSTPLVVDPVAILIAALLFVGGFSLFTALLVAIGAMMPSVKDASSAFAAVIIMMFLPLYMLSMLASDPRSPVTQVFTYFPGTAPVTAQIRNATGTLSLPEALIALVVLYVTAAALLWLAVRLFGQGSISYDSRLKLSAITSALRRSKHTN